MDRELIQMCSAAVDVTNLLVTRLAETFVLWQARRHHSRLGAT